MEDLKLLLAKNSNWLIPIGAGIVMALLDYLIEKSKSKNSTLLSAILKIFKKEVKKKTKKK